MTETVPAVPDRGLNNAQASNLEQESAKDAAVYLSESGLQLFNEWTGRFHDAVPPSTPNSGFLFDFAFQKLPQPFPQLAALEIPEVRTKGVKSCIDELAEYFHCADYKFNLLHFWFLDIVVDCLWRTQDQFEFPAKQQKIILAWLLFTLDLIRDSKNFTREEFFAVFKETILVAAEVLEEGGGEILLPLRLVSLRSSSEESCSEVSNQTKKSSTTEESKSSLFGSEQTTVEKNTMDYDSVLEFQAGRESTRFVLKHERCNCSEMGESLSYTFEKALDEQSVCYDKLGEEVFQELGEYMSEHEEEETVDGSWDYQDFYKPDPRVPSRFLPLSQSQELLENVQKKDLSLKDIGPISELTIMQIGQVTKENVTEKLSDYIIFRKEPLQKSTELICGEEQSGESDENKDEPTFKPRSRTESENTQRERVMKGLRKFKLMEQRVKDFSDSNIGLADWQMEESDREDVEVNPEDEEDQCLDDEEIAQLKEEDDTKELEEREFLSFGALWAVIDFVYEYFSDSFQYSLIKTALTAPPNLIVQKLNDEWRTPKDLKEDLTVFVKDLKDKYKKITLKPKKEKKAKAKKPAKEKKADKGKKGDKSDKKSAKADKKSDKSKKGEKPKKGDKKEDKKKKKELTEEELLAMQILAEEEAEKLKQEMNKKFLFPLQESVNDEFFMSKFPDWQKVDFRAKKGKGKGAKNEKGKKKK